MRKTRSLEAVIPWLVSQGHIQRRNGRSSEVPGRFGRQASTVSRLKQVWGQEYQTWRESRLGQDLWVYIWADSVYSGLRGEQAKLCALVIIDVNERREKHFLTIAATRLWYNNHTVIQPGSITNAI